MNNLPIDHKRIPAFPRITAQIADDGTGEVSINGISQPVTGKSIDDVRARIVTVVSTTADKIGRPVKATTTDPDGIWPLVIHPDGTVEQDSSAPTAKARTETKAPPRAPAPSTPSPRPTQAPPPTPAASPHLVQTVEQDEAARLRARWQSAQWWEEAINENNREHHLRRVTLMEMEPAQPGATSGTASNAPRDGGAPQEQAPPPSSGVGATGQKVPVQG